MTLKVGTYIQITDFTLTKEQTMYSRTGYHLLWLHRIHLFYLDHLSI
jgi:hypothetical protein